MQVFVNKQPYKIVTFKGYIDPNTLKYFPYEPDKPQNRESVVFMDNSGNLISDADLAQKIGVIKLANEMQSSEGPQIPNRIKQIDERLQLHRMIQTGDFLSDALATIMADSIRAYLTMGQTFAQDIIRQAKNTAMFLIANPENVINVFVYKEFTRAKEEYQKAYDIQKTWATKDVPFNDYENAYDFLNHLFTGHVNWHPSRKVLDAIPSYAASYTLALAKSRK